MPPKMNHLSLLSMEQEFEDYLKSKNIDPDMFKANEPGTFSLFRSEFLQLHPGSFTMQKLYFLNIIRRKYTFTDPSSGEENEIKRKPMPAKPSTGNVGKVKPVMKPVVKQAEKEMPKKPAIKPRLASSTGEETKKQARPVIKPVIPVKRSGHSEKEQGSEKQQPDKRKINKPMIRPKIQKPKKDN